jgi:outer membrane protein TolC
MSLHKNIFIAFFTVCVLFTELSAKGTFSFSGIPEEKKITEEIFTDYIRNIIILQPEYLESKARNYELSENKKYAQRLRFPTIGGSIINDRSIRRNIEDVGLFNQKQRKIRDDSFDGVISIEQPLYTGNEISSKIKLAKSEIAFSGIESSEIASELILTAVQIYLDAASSVLLNNYAIELLSKIRKHKESARLRFEAGATENSEYALVNIRFSEIEVNQALLEANKIQKLLIFKSFFGEEYSSVGLPSMKLFENESYNNLDIQSNSYNEQKSDISIKQQKHKLEITKSQYRPNLGFSMRYTKYDIDEDGKDNDLRGGIYFSLPIFNFGRGSAEVAAGNSRINQAIINKNKVVRDTRNKSANIFGSFYGSLQARSKLINSYENVKLQRETFEIRMASSFSIPALLEAVSRELNLYQQLIENEKSLLMADLNNRHLKRELLSTFYLTN